VEGGGLDVESGHLGIADLDALRRVIFVEATGDGEGDADLKRLFLRVA
jgi:hypothetical protein